MRLNTLLSLFAFAGQGLANNELSDRDPAFDPLDFSWVANWAAVGDSFTAGIGSGNVYSSRKEDKACSRYDYSYPSIMNQFFGSSVSNFTYLACSGDTSVDIAAQIARLSKGLDLAVMTAGGNDLCLVSSGSFGVTTAADLREQTTIIKTCILNSVTSESSCQKAIKTAQTAIDGILEDNIVSLLSSLDDKMDARGVIVLSSYAPYFDNTTSDCTNREDWVFPGQAGSTSLLLSTAHRTSFNTLVAYTNAKLKSAVDKVAKTASSTVIFADWSAWGKAVGGRFCEKGSSPDPSSSTNDNAMFYKLPTYKVFNPGTIYRRDSDLGHDPMLGISSNATSVQGEIEAEEANWDQMMESISNPLSKRDAPTTGVCGTNSGGGWLPDDIGKIFHPTNFGHEAIASYVTFAIGNAVAKMEDTTTPACNLVDDLTCHSSKGSKSYASAYSLYAHTAEFCKAVIKAWDVDGNTKTSTKVSKTYNKDTVDEVTFTITKDSTAVTLHETGCNAAVNRILDGCDGNDDDNPMNWKSGGVYANGAYKYDISPTRTNRPFPVPKEPSAKCSGVYHGFWTRYNIRGAGWATWDKGQKTLRGNSTRCFGHGLTGWYFEYFDKPDKDGYEWLAKFNSPVFTEARCYANNKVQKWAGGPSSDGCH
ncbi:unnamed protein product [Penicillium salamii]|nr:unnamed protein product [Penicillium salamii]CAG8375982.1 unnamed protein product [Penicillium salamii]